MFKKIIKNIFTKLWHYRVHIIISLIIIQLIGYLRFGLLSFFIITPIILFVALYLVVDFLLKYFVKSKIRKTNLQLVNITVFSTLIIVEIILRISGTVATYSEKRFFHYRSYYDSRNVDYYINGHQEPAVLKSGFEYSYSRLPNSEGFSDKDWQISKPDSIYRIVALGDSFTEGDGAHSDSTWMKFLERQLNDNHFEYMNAGLCGNDAVFLYYVFENKLLKYNPDLAILCINRSDINDIVFRGGFERFNDSKITFNKAPWWEPIYAASHIARLCFNPFYGCSLIRESEIEERRTEAIKIIQSSLLKFKNLCDENNCDFICVIHPMSPELLYGTNDLETLIPYCQNNSIKYIDLYDFFKQNNADKNIDKYYWKKDGHHNSKGYELMSKGIYSSFYKTYYQNR